MMKTVNEPLSLTEADLLHTLLNSQILHLFWKDAERRFLGANGAFLDVYGIEDISELIGKTDEDMGWHIDEDPFRADEWKVLKEGKVFRNRRGTCIIRGVAHKILASKEPMYNEKGEIVGLVGSFVIADELYKDNPVQNQAALTDNITGMMSMPGLANALTEYLDGWEIRNENFAVILVEIPEYDQAVQELGELISKIILREAAHLIASAAGKNCVCARRFGGSFAILAKCREKEQIRQRGERIRDAVAESVTLKGYADIVHPTLTIYYADETEHLYAIATSQRKAEKVENHAG